MRCIGLKKRHVVIEKLRVKCPHAGLLTILQLAMLGKFVEMAGATTAHPDLTNVLVIKGFTLEFVQTINSAIPLDASLQASRELIRKHILQISPCVVQLQRLQRAVTIIF